MHSQVITVWPSFLTFGVFSVLSINMSHPRRSRPLLIATTHHIAATPKPRTDCHYNSGVYKFRERLEIGCEQICHCAEGGVMDCRPRCPERNHTRLDKCVYVKDPKDVCCQLELCDVTLDDHEQQPTPLQSNNNEDPEEIDPFRFQEQARDTGGAKPTCTFKGAEYDVGQQFRDGCDQLCICNEQGIHCAKLECPSNFGLDVQDPHCIRWEPVPADFKPSPPNCCPESMRCVDNGTCSYQGVQIENWSPVPANLTGKIVAYSPPFPYLSNMASFTQVAISIVIARMDG